MVMCLITAQKVNWKKNVRKYLQSVQCEVYNLVYSSEMSTVTKKEAKVAGNFRNVSMEKNTENQTDAQRRNIERNRREREPHESLSKL